MRFERWVSDAPVSLVRPAPRFLSLLQLVVLLFTLLNRLSLSQAARVYLRGPDYRTLPAQSQARSSRDAREVRLIDAYVVASFLIIIAAYIQIRIWDHGFLNGVFLVLTLYVLSEMMVRAVNVVMFDNLRGHGPPESIERNIILGVVNYAQVIFGFAAFAQMWFVDGSSDHFADDTDSLWMSAKAATLIDLPNSTDGWVRFMFTAEAFVAIFLLVILLAWAISNLPRRASN